jgi:hypothetical protein
MNMAEADEGADGITFAAFASGKCAAMLLRRLCLCLLLRACTALVLCCMSLLLVLGGSPGLVSLADIRPKP